MFLKDGETILFTGATHKRKGYSNKRRQLILSKSVAGELRLFYVDPSGPKVRTISRLSPPVVPRPNTHRVSSRRAQPTKLDRREMIPLNSSTSPRPVECSPFTTSHVYVRLRLLPSPTQGTAVYRGEVPWTQEAPVHAVFKDEKNFDAVSPGKDEGDFRCVGRMRVCRLSHHMCDSCYVRCTCGNVEFHAPT